MKYLFHRNFISLKGMINSRFWVELCFFKELKSASLSDRMKLNRFIFVCRKLNFRKKMWEHTSISMIISSQCNSTTTYTLVNFEEKDFFFFDCECCLHWQSSFAIKNNKLRDYHRLVSYIKTKMRWFHGILLE